MQEPSFDLLEFARSHLVALLVLLLGWALLIYGLLRLLGVLHVRQRARYRLGGAALIVGGLLLWDACGQL